MGDATSQSDSTVEVLSMQELFPLHDFGSWPEAFTASREQIYYDDRAAPVTPPTGPSDLDTPSRAEQAATPFRRRP